MHIHSIQLGEKLSAAYDVIHSSPVKSNDSVRNIEESINEIVNSLDNDLSVDEIDKELEKLLDLFKQRQDTLRLLR